MAYLKSLIIDGFYGYAEAQTFDFAVPDGKTPGSGLTILVGPNGGGKSSVLESLLIVGSEGCRNVKQNRRNARANRHVIIEAVPNIGQNIVFASAPSNPETIIVRPKEFAQKSFPIFFVPALRVLPLSVPRTTRPAGRSEYMQTYAFRDERQALDSNFHGRVKRFCESTNFSLFYELLDELVGYRVNISFADNGQLEAHTQHFLQSPVGLGTGLNSLVYIVDALYDIPNDSGSIVVIDEPELSLHPDRQKVLLNTLARISRDNQIIIATHSPYFIDWDLIKNGARLVRTAKSPQDGYCRISQPQPKTMTAIVDASRDINNPHAYGTNAKEIFFVNNGVILVEGPEDVFCIQKFAKDYNRMLKRTLYGWGVGGAEKMKIVCSLLRELNLSDIVIVLDNDKKPEAEKLQNELGIPVIVLPVKNIRDKREQKDRPAITGLCDTKGNVHDERIKDVEFLLQQLTT